jgi:hypothetical protein
VCSLQPKALSYHAACQVGRGYGFCLGGRWTRIIFNGSHHCISSSSSSSSRSSSSRSSSCRVLDGGRTSTTTPTLPQQEIFVQDLPGSHARYYHEATPQYTPRPIIVLQRCDTDTDRRRYGMIHHTVTGRGRCGVVVVLPSSMVRQRRRRMVGMIVVMMHFRRCLWRVVPCHCFVGISESLHMGQDSAGSLSNLGYSGNE